MHTLSLSPLRRSIVRETRLPLVPSGETEGLNLRSLVAAANTARCVLGCRLVQMGATSTSLSSLRGVCDLCRPETFYVVQWGTSQFDFVLDRRYDGTT